MDTPGLYGIDHTKTKGLANTVSSANDIIWDYINNCDAQIVTFIWHPHPFIHGVCVNFSEDKWIVIVAMIMVFYLTLALLHVCRKP